ncbi:MAG TPA: hypothetical protein DCP92_22935 [Nitrospiraceae bacterium]|nr:hypothetical protein [Nitrospiraceae bacterium]
MLDWFSSEKAGANYFWSDFMAGRLRLFGMRGTRLPSVRTFYDVKTTTYGDHLSQSATQDSIIRPTKDAKKSFTGIACNLSALRNCSEDT